MVRLEVNLDYMCSGDEMIGTHVRGPYLVTDG